MPGAAPSLSLSRSEGTAWPTASSVGRSARRGKPVDDFTSVKTDVNEKGSKILSSKHHLLRLVHVGSGLTE